MKLKQLLYIFLLVSFISCSEEKHPLLTDDDRALSLLLDLNIANIAKNKYPTTLRDSIDHEYKMQICDLYDLQEEELDTLLWMMQSDFERYNVLYSKLVDTLKRLENKFGSGNKKPIRPYKKMIDSIEANKIKK